MEPILVRHRPRRDLVHDQGFCLACGGLGHYFFINADDPGDIFTVDCNSMECAQPERTGVPDPTPTADTNKIEVFNEEERGPRGIRYGRNGLVTTADAISGDIIVSKPRKTK